MNFRNELNWKLNLYLKSEFVTQKWIFNPKVNLLSQSEFVIPKWICYPTGLSISFALSVSQLMNILVRASADFEASVTSLERIGEYCQAGNCEAEWIVAAAAPELTEWPDKGGIEFARYSAGYREDLDFVLKDIDCRIEPCEKVGAVVRLLTAWRQSEARDT